MLILIDESGDAGFKIARGSSPYVEEHRPASADFLPVADQPRKTLDVNGTTRNLPPW